MEQKSNQEKTTMTRAMEKMITERIIMKCKETKPYLTGKERAESKQTFSVGITGVEKCIKDEDISKQLT